MNLKQFMEQGSYILDEVKEKSKENSKHFFDVEARRFFSSRVSELCWKVKENIYFITSEQDKDTRVWHPGCLRGWTIRLITNDGSINKVGEFQQYESLRAARYGLKEIIAN